MVMDPGGLNATIVAPGSDDDPFTDPSKAASANDSVDQPTSQPDPKSAATPSAAPSDGKMSKEEVEALINGRISGLQSTYDRRLAALNSQLEAERATAAQRQTEAIKATRAAQLETMRPDQRDVALRSWEAEDTRAELGRKEEALMDLYKAVEGQRLLAAYGDFGIVEDDIIGFDGEAVQMEDYIKGLAFDRLRSGGTSSKAANAAVDAAAAKAPAGASATQDLGGQPSSQPADGFDKGSGLTSMAANVKSLFSTGQGRPW